MAVKAWLKPEQVPAEYRRLLERAIIDTASENKLEYELWHQDGPISYLRRKEFDFERFVQISFAENKPGLDVLFTPNLAHYNKSTGKRRTRSDITPYIFILTIRFLFSVEYCEPMDSILQYLKIMIKQAWEKSYYITPDMLDFESNL